MNTPNQRLDPSERKARILDAAVEVARKHGVASTSRKRVAEQAGVSPALVSAYFTTMAKMRRAVVRQAIQQEILPIVAAALANGDASARKAPAELQRRALASITPA